LEANGRHRSEQRNTQMPIRVNVKIVKFGQFSIRSAESAPDVMRDRDPGEPTATYGEPRETASKQFEVLFDKPEAKYIVPAETA